MEINPHFLYLLYTLSRVFSDFTMMMTITGTLDIWIIVHHHTTSLLSLSLFFFPQHIYLQFSKYSNFWFIGSLSHSLCMYVYSLFVYYYVPCFGSVSLCNTD